MQLASRCGNPAFANGRSLPFWGTPSRAINRARPLRTPRGCSHAPYRYPHSRRLGRVAHGTRAHGITSLTRLAPAHRHGRAQTPAVTSASHSLNLQHKSAAVTITIAFASARVTISALDRRDRPISDRPRPAAFFMQLSHTKRRSETFEFAVSRARPTLTFAPVRLW